MDRQRDRFGPFVASVNGRELDGLVDVWMERQEGTVVVESVKGRGGFSQKISLRLIDEVKEGHDRERDRPCVKIYSYRWLLFVRLYPPAQRDASWLAPLLAHLQQFRRGGLALRRDTHAVSLAVYRTTLEAEFTRLLGTMRPQWRFSAANSDYSLCSTYSQVLPVPADVSDTVLLHAARFRVRNRHPLLSFVHRETGRALMRSGQPLVGLAQRRCIQDEKLIEALKRSAVGPAGLDAGLLIVDARPSTSAIANAVIGAGTERLECYEGSERIYLNLENIHGIRESHDRLCHQIKRISRSVGREGRIDGEGEEESERGGDDEEMEKDSSDSNNSNSNISPPSCVGMWIEVEESCVWLDHLRRVLEGVGRIVDALHSGRLHVLVHCSDGWDRTTQLVSLAQLCLDPFYRTRHGFQRLILKDWLAAGHRFDDRNGHGVRHRDTTASSGTRTPWESLRSLFVSAGGDGASEDVREQCPIFLQFIEAVVQLVRQHPLHFSALTDDFLLQVVDAAIGAADTASLSDSVFRGNCEAERVPGLLHTELVEVEAVEAVEADSSVIVPQADRSKMFLWPAFYKRHF